MDTNLGHCSRAGQIKKDQQESREAAQDGAASLLCTYYSPQPRPAIQRGRLPINNSSPSTVVVRT